MTTYNTYQEAKIANPKAYIVTTRDDWDGNESIKGNFEVFDASDQGGHYIGFNSWRICNPADHCITVEEFLARGHKLIKGDVYLDYDGEVVEFICVCDNSQSNTNRKENDVRYILRASALENIPTETPEEKEVLDSIDSAGDAEWKNGDECVISQKSKSKWLVVGVSPLTKTSTVCVSNTGELKSFHTEQLKKPETPQQREDRERLEAIDAMCWSVHSLKVSQASALYEAGYRKEKSHGTN
ncbi:hypothetical protein NVP1149O_71 [Vibrio phage 1.149.O._10N.286.55.A12]|nr:hypothetical protein NVP1149O_71 [Vibrio phage 1.149.O._10N.286.55.A12]